MPKLVNYYSTIWQQAFETLFQLAKVWVLFKGKKKIKVETYVGPILKVSCSFHLWI